MSDRQKVRDQRKRLFWSARYAAAATDAARLLVAFDEIRAAIADLPREEQEPARRLVTAHLRQLPKLVAESQVHKREVHSGPGQVRPSTRPAATRTRARREV